MSLINPLLSPYTTMNVTPHHIIPHHIKILNAINVKHFNGLWGCGGSIFNFLNAFIVNPMHRIHKDGGDFILLFSFKLHSLSSL